MVSFTARRGSHDRRKGHMLQGKVPHKLMHRMATGGTLPEQYAARMLKIAHMRQGRRRKERPDDKEPIQPANSKEPINEEGDQDPQISGARLEEMLKLAGGQEIAS